MRRFFALVAVVAVVLVVLAVVGEGLPEGNPLRDATEGLRAVGRNIADGFGGGYGPINSG